jgi:hypothetical protein
LTALQQDCHKIATNEVLQLKRKTG